MDTVIPIEVPKKVLLSISCNFTPTYLTGPFDPSEELYGCNPRELPTTEQLEGLKTVTKPLLVLDLDYCLLESNSWSMDIPYASEFKCDLYMEVDRWVGTKERVYVNF